jgi:hypothetical protein
MLAINFLFSFIARSLVMLVLQKEGSGKAN